MTILKTAFFLQGSYIFTYIPLMIMLFALALWLRAQVPLFASFLLSVQSVMTSYMVAGLLSMLMGLLATYLNYPLYGLRVQPIWYYYGAIVLSVACYSVLQWCLLLPYHAQLKAGVFSLLVACNIMAAGIMIGLHGFLFLRHVV